MKKIFGAEGPQNGESSRSGKVKPGQIKFKTIPKYTYLVGEWVSQVVQKPYDLLGWWVDRPLVAWYRFLLFFGTGSAVLYLPGMICDTNISFIRIVKRFFRAVSCFMYHLSCDKNKR